MPRDVEVPCTRSYEKEFFLNRSPFFDFTKEDAVKNRHYVNLWVRETFTATPDDRENYMYTVPERQTILYRADPFFQDMPKGDLGRDWNWTPSIHMPRWASRITLEVTGVRVARVQDISEEDAEKEGVILSGRWNANETEYGPTYRVGYSVLWDKLNAKRGFTWDSNPWVWAVEFRRVEG
jgi:hypothetical protein